MEDEVLLNTSPTDNTSPNPVNSGRDLFGNTVQSTPLGKMGSQMASTFNGENTGFGDSKYDEGALWGVDIDRENPTESINENRYNQQSGLTQIGAGVLRAGAKAALEVAKLPGVVIGAIGAIGAKEGEGYDTAFNNQWIKAIDGLNETINTEALPVYVGKAIKEGNLWDNITSTSFWATDGADGAGYMLAMMAPGALFNELGLGAKLLSNSRKAAQLVGMAEKTEAAVTALKGLRITAKSIDLGVGAIGNTIFEAGAEAKGVGDDLDAKKDDFITSYKSSEDYEDKFLFGKRDLDNQLKQGAIDINDYNQKIEDLSVDIAENKFKEQRALAMRDTFKSNLAILIGPNLLMSKAIWGKAPEKLLSEVEQTAVNTLSGRAKQWGTRWAKAFASEGFVEEAGQTTVENLFVKKALKNELGKGQTDNFKIGELTEGYLDTISSTEGQKAIFLGGMMGGPFMSYQGRKEDVQNARNSNEILTKLDNSINSFNTIFDTDIYKTDENGGYIYKKDEKGNDTTEKEIDKLKALEVAKSLDFNEFQSAMLDHAIETGNTEVVDQIKKKAIFDMITPAIQNGEAGLNALEQKLNESSKFQELIARDADPKTKQTTKQFVTETLDAAKHLQKQNEKFQDFAGDIIELKDERATPENKSDFINKLNNQYLNVKYKQYNSEKELKVLEKKRASILEELGLENNLVTEDEQVVSAEKESTLLKDTNDKIRETEESIAKNKKDINGLWSGKSQIANSFKDYLDKQDKKKEELSDTKEQELQDVIDKIDSATTIDDLKNIKSDNPIINQKLESKKKILEEIEEAKKAIELESQANTQEEREASVEEGTLTTEVPTQYDNDTEGSEVHEELQETDSKNLEGRDVPSNLGHAKLLSTNRDTGEKLDFISQQFLDYERTPINKVGKEVFFSINNEAGSKNKNWKKALGILESEDFSITNVDFLIEHLPINVNITNDIFAPIETQPNGAKAKEVFNESSRILRVLIVNELVKGTDISDISTKILGQFPGNLKIEEGPVQENSILELDAVKKNLVNINKNIFMINSQKDKQFADGTTEPFVNSDMGRVNGIGEIYLNIPQANGQNYPLKLNIRKINRIEAEIIADIYQYRLDNKVGKETPISTLPQNIQDRINNELSDIVKIISSKGKKSKDITIKDIIDFMIWDGTSNKKSMVKLTGTGVKGETVLKFGKTTVTSLNDNSREMFINWLTESKRHNIKFKAKKNESNEDKIDINDKVYLDYLLSSKTLNTNAVVNEPTFQGYANIYLENSIKVDGVETSSDNNKSTLQPKEKKVKEKVIKTEQVEPEVISTDFNPYDRKVDGENLYYTNVDGIDYYASDKSGKVYESKDIDNSNLKSAPKAEDIYGNLVTDNTIIAQIQENIRTTEDDWINNPNIKLNFYENIRNSEENFVSLQEIPNTLENKELKELQKENVTFANLSEDKQNELLTLLKTKLKDKVSLLKDKEYVAIAKSKDSQRIYDYLTNLAKENDIDIKEIEKHCK